MRLLRLLVGCVLVLPRIAAADCGVDRWPVKIAADADAGAIRPIPIPVSIESLHAVPTPRPLPQEHRIAPVETSIYSVTATIIAYRLAPDSSVQLVLADDVGRTILAQVPAPTCAGGSRFSPELAAVRLAVDRRFAPTATFKQARVAVEVNGVGFFDFFQSQRGLAPNGLGLYPLIAIDFSPTFKPKAPPSNPRRRAVSPPGGCSVPSLTLSTSQSSVCGGQTTTVAWSGSDSHATVSIEGIGSFLPASGSRVVSVSSNTAFSGRASNSCGAGDEAVAVVGLKTAATALLTGPSSVNSGGTALLGISINGATGWTLRSSLGNSISPSSGTTSGSASYAASRTGTDVVTLTVTGGACGSVPRTITITVIEPTNSGLRCCDGTRSPSCFNCNDKRGCCSGHGGVCGCASLNDAPVTLRFAFPENECAEALQ